MGRWQKRFDLSYPALKLIIEHDGRHHASDDRQWKREIVRRESLEGDGWRLIVIQSQDIHVEPATTLDRIADAMRQYGALPRTFNHQWETHFPSR